MQIKRASHLGFCYGVRRAIDMAEACSQSAPAHTLGPIIHNPQMVAQLAEKGIAPADNLEDIPSGTVIIRSHGVGPVVYQTAADRQLTVVDATCPHVKKAQQAAHALYTNGFDVVVVGEKNHPEVKSIALWTEDTANVVETAEEASRLPYTARLGIVAQTTFAGDEFERILAVLKTKAAVTEVRRTICTATDQRQQAAIELSGEVDLMIVIGGRNSANTTRLAEICRRNCSNVKHIETASELQGAWFEGVRSVGITAGASTPDWIIEEVVHRMEQFEQMLNEVTELERGAVVKGTVISVRRDEVFVDIGYKGEGVITLKELAYPVPTDAGDVVTPGQEIDVFVLNADSADGIVHLSKVRADRISAWHAIEQAAAEKLPVNVKVTEVVKGGLAVAINGIRGFIPASQVALRFVEDLSSYIGQTLAVLPIETEAKKQRVVLSRRAILEEEKRKCEEEVFARIKAGDTVNGTVRRLADFGAFVDIGGVEGLIHISDLAWHRVTTPSDIVNVGDAVEVYVLKVDEGAKKISLSLKQIQPDPWFAAASAFTEGQIVPGIVTKLAKFGAFVKLADGVEGLVHISELSDRRVASADAVVKPGQGVKVAVLGVDRANKRISLSISKAQQEAEQAEYQDYLRRQEEQQSTSGDKFGQLRDSE